MGKILKVKKLTTFAEGAICALGLILLVGVIMWISPGLRTSVSKSLSGLKVDSKNVDNTMQAEELPLPSTDVSSKVSSQPKVRIAAYAWNAQSGIIVSNGGANTTEGSLMEQNNVNLNFVRQDMVTTLKEMQLKFVEEYNAGVDYPKSDKSAFGVIIMGDGAPFYISTMQKALDEKFGKDKYHLEVAGAVGISYGEDKLIGPPSWKANPKSMLGSVISVVVGDGDWVTSLNYCFANGLKVNPDLSTYDPEAVNFYPSENDDYMKSAEELIKSQTAGFTVNLKEVKNGKLTGKSVAHKIDGCATWTPGDKKVFDALTGFTDIASTKEFNNQMPTTLIVVREWAQKHSDIVSNILKSAYIAGNQMKLYDKWAKRASEAVASTYALETPEYWYKMFKGQTAEKNGIKYSMGGSRVFNYADAMQYYGIGGDGIDRYKSVYEQVSNYLIELNPFDFNSSVDGVTPYDKAVNMFYIKNINGLTSGSAYKADYSKQATDVVASGEWHINFATGSDNILSSSNKEMEKVYNLMMQAEDSKLKLVGHTDNTGNNDINTSLSEKRAQAVVDYLIKRGISKDRIQSVSGAGASQPLADNSTEAGRSQNRRVEITFLK